MTMRLRSLFTTIVVVSAALNTAFVATSFVHADSTVIKYGDVITDNLTDKQADVSYTFDAKKDDVIALEFTTIAAKDKNLSASFQVLNKNQSNTVFGSSGLFASPDDETYTATISSINGEGKFVLKLIKAQPLTLGKAITGTISYDKDGVPTSAYYYFTSNNPFIVKLDTPLPSATAANTVNWGLAVRQRTPSISDYSDVYSYNDNMNALLSTSVTIKGNDSVTALGVRASGYTFGDTTKGASQSFTLLVTAATP